MRIAAGVLVFTLMSLGAPRGRCTRADDNQDAARAWRHFETGTRFYQVGEYRKALAEFRQAHVAKPDPAFLYNSAQCHRQLGERTEALTLYRRYLAMVPDSPKRDQIEKHIRELEAPLVKGPPAAPALGAAPALVTMLATPTPEARAPGPLYRRWWLWAGAGAVVAAVATAVFLSIGGSPSDPACPPAVECPATTR